MAASRSRFIIIDPASRPLADLPSQLAAASAGETVALAVAATLPSALSQLVAAHTAHQPAMAVFLPAAQATDYCTALWELDATLPLVLCGTPSELQAVAAYSLHGPWHTLREPYLEVELQSLAQRLSAQHLSQHGSRAQLEQMQSLLAERSTALTESHMHFALQFHESPLPQALFRYADGSCVDTNAAFTELTGHETDIWREQALHLLQQTGLHPAVAGPHPRRAVSLRLSTPTPQRSQHVLIYTQLLHFGPEPCLLLTATASPRSPEPTHQMALRA